VQLQLIEKSGKSQKITLERLIKRQTKTAPSPKCLVIESQPGCSRTTLSWKIAYNWALTVNEDKVSNAEVDYMSKFRITFVFPLRFWKDLETLDITEAIEKYYKIDSKRGLQSLLAEKTLNVLIILDGYEETSTELKQQLRSFLSENIYEHVTVIITCRTGLFDLNLPSCCYLSDTDTRHIFHMKADC